MKVSNMTSARGNKIANQFLIDNCIVTVKGSGKHKGTMFQSYDSNIAFKSYDTGMTYLDKNYWNYSVTTGKYRNQFLNETKKDTQRKIDNGTYKLVDLN